MSEKEKEEKETTTNKEIGRQLAKIPGPTKEQSDYIRELIEWREESARCICPIGGGPGSFPNPKCPLHYTFVR